MSSIAINLPTELTIAQVEEFKSTVLELIAQQDEISINDSEIIRIDTTGLQLIVAIITYVLSLNKKLVWQCSASCILESIKKLGINEPILNQYLPN